MTRLGAPRVGRVRKGAQNGTTQTTLIGRREKKSRRILQPCLLFCAANLVHDFCHGIALRLILLQYCTTQAQSEFCQFDGATKIGGNLRIVRLTGISWHRLNS